MQVVTLSYLPPQSSVSNWSFQNRILNCFTSTYPFPLGYTLLQVFAAAERKTGVVRTRLPNPGPFIESQKSAGLNKKLQGFHMAADASWVRLELPTNNGKSQAWELNPNCFTVSPPKPVSVIPGQRLINIHRDRGRC